MRITDAFLGEHGLFYGLFGEISTAMLGPKCEIETLARALSALVVTHAQLEEEILFPALREHIGPMGPIEVMEMEHRQIEELLETIPHTKDTLETQQLVQELIDICVGHFAKEEGVLFPLANQVLDQDELERLGRLWAERRGVNLEAMGCAA